MAGKATTNVVEHSLPPDRTPESKHITETDCRLLELPGELRNKIYELALYHPYGVFINLELRKKRGGNLLAITKSCKQIKKECGNLFFELNEININVPYLACTNKCAIQTITVFREREKLLIKGLRRAPKLQRVHLHVGKFCDAFDNIDVSSLDGRWEKAWDLALGSVMELRSSVDQLRLSFCVVLGNARASCDVQLTNREQTQAKMKQCFQSAKAQGPREAMLLMSVCDVVQEIILETVF